MSTWSTRCVRAGASGFLLKDVTPSDFVKAIRIVAAGDALIAPSVMRRLVDRFARMPVPTDEPHAASIRQLTERELEVLRLVARGLSNREIAEHLTLAEPTVKTHVSHLLPQARPARSGAAGRVGLRGGRVVRPGSADPRKV